MIRHEAIDLANQITHALERAATDRLVGDQGEEALDLIEPGTVSRNEMQMPTGPAASHALTFACLWVL